MIASEFSTSIRNTVRNTVLILILFVAWYGILVLVVPIVVYQRLRAMGANSYQSLFLAATTCLLVSSLLLLVEH